MDLDAIAATTPGMTGADLANLANEAALAATPRGHDAVHMRDFTTRWSASSVGAERKNVMTSDDRRRTAYHEAGHAIVGMFTPGADPVRKVSIIPRGQALGVTFSAPERDRLSYDQKDLLARIRVALGGRAAEELVFGTHTTGAESDPQQITDIARRMVPRWGMGNAIGPMVTRALTPKARCCPAPPTPHRTSSALSTGRCSASSLTRTATSALLVEHREALGALALTQ